METNKIYKGDVLKVLKTFPDKSVHCCVTSPPYWGLRDYGMEGQLGLEPTPEGYIEKMVKIFNEVKRVLRDDGTLWLNLGDSYGGSGKGTATYPASNWKWKQNTNKGTLKEGIKNFTSENIKRKDLIGIPWMVAFALRNTGWYLRQDIIWHKPNSMPESVTDRCTKSHEYIFLLSKSDKYFYDYEAIKKPLSEGSFERKLRGVSANNKYANGAPDSTAHSLSQQRQNIKKSVVGGKKHKNLTYKGQTINGIHKKRNQNGQEWQSNDLKANKKSVWIVSTKGYNGAHFATFPEKLIVDCIKAGTSEHGCCASCGKPYIRVVEKKLVPTAKASYHSKCDVRDKLADKNDQGSNRQKDGHKPGWAYNSKTIAWEAQCNCNDNVVPCVVLDVFMGAGTTGLVAKKLGRDYIGVDINPEYIKLANKRIYNEIGLFL